MSQVISKDSLGDRMKKNYEDVNRVYLTRRMPTIIRVDGKAFHTFTRGMEKPFDMILVRAMQETAAKMCAHMGGCKLAYVQSDEISFLITDYDNLNTNAWLEKSVQKMVSISASMATSAFNMSYERLVRNEKWLPASLDFMIEEKKKKYISSYNTYINKVGIALFDSRVFNIPEAEVCNYFVWRQQDATRNAIQMVAQANFSHKKLQGMSCNALQEMLFTEKGINFNDLEVYLKRGTCIVKKEFEVGSITRSKWEADLSIPIFTANREYIEGRLPQIITTEFKVLKP